MKMETKVCFIIKTSPVPNSWPSCHQKSLHIYGKIYLPHIHKDNYNDKINLVDWYTGFSTSVSELHCQLISLSLGMWEQDKTLWSFQWLTNSYFFCWLCPIPPDSSTKASFQSNDMDFSPNIPFLGRGALICLDFT